MICIFKIIPTTSVSDLPEGFGAANRADLELMERIYLPDNDVVVSAQ